MEGVTEGQEGEEKEGRDSKWGQLTAEHVKRGDNVVRGRREEREREREMERREREERKNDSRKRSK